MSTVTPHLNLLDRALKKRGVSLKRTQLVEIAAEAFGFHNSHEFTTAVAKAKIPLPLIADPNNTPVDTNWLDISSAPRNGTKILLWLRPPYAQPALASWYEPWECWIPDGSDPSTIDAKNDELFGIGAMVPMLWAHVTIPKDQKSKSETKRVST